MYQDGYEAILLDYELPDMTGLEICKSIRKQEEEKASHIPIVVTTCCQEEGVQQQCLAMGADRFIAKPLRVEDLKQLLQALLET
jgi:CheY-like chemotaxis protein